MKPPERTILQKGIISVLQTPFEKNGAMDLQSLVNLIEDAIRAGVDGFLVPAVASEVEFLSKQERVRLARFVSEKIQKRVPLILGASSARVEECRFYAALAEEIQADACLAAVPEKLYGSPGGVVPFFQSIAAGTTLPLIIQDLQWNGYGLSISEIVKMKETIPSFIGIKIETLLAGPKYTSVRCELGNDFFICGGWAIQQAIEALDRGVDALIPESSMVRVYKAIDRMYRRGERSEALRLFRRLLPILAYTNQEITTSIVFFKRLLVRKGIFRHSGLRRTGFVWDRYNTRIADELIELYLQLEADFACGC